MDCENSKEQTPLIDAISDEGCSEGSHCLP